MFPKTKKNLLVTYSGKLKIKTFTVTGNRRGKRTNTCNELEKRRRNRLNRLKERSRSFVLTETEMERFKLAYSTLPHLFCLQLFITLGFKNFLFFNNL